MRIRLVVTAGPHEGREFSFNGHDTFIVGRGSRAHFRLPAKDGSFSRMHFLVEINPPLCRIMDLGSRNGTFVNGSRVQMVDLSNGDVLRAGRCIIKVELQYDREEMLDGSTMDVPEAIPKPRKPDGKPTPAILPKSEPKTKDKAGKPSRESASPVREFSGLDTMDRVRPLNISDIPIADRGSTSFPPLPSQTAETAPALPETITPYPPPRLPIQFQQLPQTEPGLADKQTLYPTSTPKPPVAKPDSGAPTNIGLPQAQTLYPPERVTPAPTPSRRPTEEDEEDLLVPDIELDLGDSRAGFANASTLFPAQMADSAPPTAKPAKKVTPARGACRICQSTDLRAPKPGETLHELCGACRDKIADNEQLFPGFHTADFLGMGGMGMVYLALRERDGLPVAVKTLIPAQNAKKGERERFLREAAILKQLRHENIVAHEDQGETHEHGEGNRPFYFAMEYVRGRTAEEILHEEGPLSVPRAIGWMCQLLSALDYAHAREFVHRDVRPANFIIAQDGRKEILKLVDFGLGKLYQSSQMSGLTLEGDIRGTLAYVAPEQVTEFRGAKPAADQYSAASSLYNLLTGKYTMDFPERVYEVVRVILDSDPVPIRDRRPDIPDGLAQAIHKALARDPEDRFPGVAEFRLALEPYL